MPLAAYSFGCRDCGGGGTCSPSSCRAARTKHWLRQERRGGDRQLGFQWRLRGSAAALAAGIWCPPLPCTPLLLILLLLLQPPLWPHLKVLLPAPSSPFKQ